MPPRANSRQSIVRPWCAPLCVVALWLACANQPLLAQAPPWVNERVKSWSTHSWDKYGNQQSTLHTWAQASTKEQMLEALGRVPSSQDRRTALWYLSAWPMEQWAPMALERGGTEAALFLYQRGYRQPGQDPINYLKNHADLERPWTHGLGLHLENGGWRFQWIPSPVLFTQSGSAKLPKGLEQAPQPGVLMHLNRLRPGLEKLVSLAGGSQPGGGTPTGMVSALAQGSRAGFLVRHLEPWLKQVSPALEPLAQREAWVLHYGADRSARPSLKGTLVFLPGELPNRTYLIMSLLKLNPLSSGARSRTLQWTGPGGSVEVQQLRGSGGVFHLVQRPEGTWISDQEAPLRALLFPGLQPTLGERLEWSRVALSGMNPGTELSFWVMPSIGADATFETQALARRLGRAQQGTWPNPFIAKAAPRTGAMSLAVGAGPTELMVQSILRVDDETAIPEPELPSYVNGLESLNPQQKKEFLAAKASAQQRQIQRQALRMDVVALQACLDPRGAALHWNGWVSAPALSAADKASLAELNRLRRESPWQAMRAQRDGKITAFGGFGEPGMAPSLALAIPIQGAKRAQVENLLKRLVPKVFKGENQKQANGAAELHRVATAQAFRPSWTLVGDTLVLGTDEGAVKAVSAGLQGQAPTLADSPSQAWARMDIDGALASKELENLVLAYLRSSSGSAWWIGAATTEDEAAAELAFSLGPFLGALRGLGPVHLEWNWSAAGLEGRPR